MSFLFWWLMITICWYYLEVLLALKLLMSLYITSWWWCLDDSYWYMKWSNLTVDNWHRFRGSIFYASNNVLLALCLLISPWYVMILINDDSYVAEMFKWYIMLCYSHGLKSEKLLETHNCFDAYDQIYGWFGWFFWWYI